MPPSIPLTWVMVSKRLWLSPVLAWRPGPAVGGCGSNCAHRVDWSCNKVEANDMCAQNLMNA